MFEYIPGFNNLSDVEYTDFRNDEEREFMIILNSYADELGKYSQYEDLFMFYDGEILSLGIYISDSRALRVDFTETSLLLGEDETHQYVSKLFFGNPKVKVFKKSEYTTVQLAEITAQWITYELSRKIELREWITESFHHKRWVIVDTDETISVSNPKGFRKSKDDLGQPTKVTVVYSGEKEY